MKPQNQDLSLRISNDALTLLRDELRVGNDDARLHISFGK